jgi:hypothetical protein
MIFPNLPADSEQELSVDNIARRVVWTGKRPKFKIIIRHKVKSLDTIEKDSS